jgi:hypothetical protein
MSNLTRYISATRNATTRYIIVSGISFIRARQAVLMACIGLHRAIPALGPQTLGENGFVLETKPSRIFASNWFAMFYDFRFGFVWQKESF